MSDNNKQQGRPAAKYEPGTLDQTRKNIGAIDAEEARRMTKILGGEIYTEKSAPIDASSMPKRKNSGYIHRAAKSAPAAAAATAASAKASAEKKERSSASSLPTISNDVRILIDKLMMSNEYRIKPNYGFFNIFRRFMRGGTELVRRDFIEKLLPRYVEYLQGFISSTQTLIQIAPDVYRQHIMDDDAERFRFLRMVGSWSLTNVRMALNALQAKSENVTVQALMPFVQELYKLLLKIYYLGETRIPAILRGVYEELIEYPDAEKKRLLAFSKDAVSQWSRVYSETIKGTYPLLLRMCSNTFEEFPQFFTVRSPNILAFLNLTKYDVLVPQKKTTSKGEPVQEERLERPKTEEELQEEADAKTKAETVEAGKKLLDQLFPDAGFDRLDSMPDMYPYFQPLYQFRDGFNLLDPLNPMQVTIVLMRILEDLFHGCRNIQFSEDAIESENDEETPVKIMSDWSQYREVLFEKNYCDQLIDFSREQYSKPDFKNTLFGKRILNSILWQTKYNFLPHFKFQQLLLEKPQNDSQLRPMCMRTATLRNFFAMLVRNIDGNTKTKGTVLGVQNPWERYIFDLPNVVSKRMDVLLGAKRMQETDATNANLIKYTLYVLTVLDWWINAPSSPAYSAGSDTIYRISEEDGNIAFGVPLRKDQNKLFAERIKANAAKNSDASN